MNKGHDANILARPSLCSRMLEISWPTAVAILTLPWYRRKHRHFQLLDAVRLRASGKVGTIAKINIDHRNGASGSFTSRYADLTYAQWKQIRERQQAFSSVFAWGTNLFNISPSGEVHNIQGLWVSGEFFHTLGVEPVLGRVLTTADDGLNCVSPGAVISYSFWKHTFAGENSVIGKTLLINRHPFEIVGVTPADFYGVEVGRYFDVAVPLCAEPIIDGEDSQLRRADGWWLSVMGRLKPGWTIKQAALQLRSIAGIFEATIPRLSIPTRPGITVDTYSGLSRVIRALRLCGVISKTLCGFSLVLRRWCC
jgi:hypothetical protein